MLAIDTGGTFTDLIAQDRDTGHLAYAKCLTTYGNLVDGVMACIREAKVDLTQAQIIKFGTTLVINTFVQRNGAQAALITTEGHRDTLGMGRGNHPVVFDLRYERDPPLIERDLCLEVDERIGGDGSIVRPLDEDQVRAVASVLAERGIEAVAVSFINSYANPTHEESAAQLLKTLMPGVYVTTGTELTREWYEYERTSTVVANAYVGPRMEEYLHQLDSRLRGDGFSETFYMMASNGGVFSVERAERQPVMLVESGPVGGCIGAGAYAVELGIEKIIAFDMGGTTAKCAVIENGRFEVKSPYYVGGYDYGFPIRGNVIDVVEVGAGGGSIAWLDPQGRLQVGPRSAGSDPGPVAYGRGGTEPTITDANLVLGRIGTSSFLGGGMPLDQAAAVKAVTESVASPLGFSGEDGLDEASNGIIELGAVTMVGAIQQITMERGLDPREFTLFAFGGGGPLHAASLAREMNLTAVIIPPEPGIFSAAGMLLADARVDETQTFLRPLTPETVDEMWRVFEKIESELQESFIRELGSAEFMFERQGLLRFRRQRHSIKASIGPGDNAEKIRETFEATYRQRYGFLEPESAVEFVGLAVSASARVGTPDLDQLRPAFSDDGGASKVSRPVYFAERSGRVETPVLQRSSLPVGFSSDGPAVIEEYGSTTIVGPDDRFEIGRLGEIRIQIGQLSSGEDHAR
ncbi:MAG: N-methylhydantoinase A [Alphaproteobacteria bacterium]|jgi:N-methylhydantoinase A